MTVEDAAHRVGDRFGHVVAIDEYRIEAVMVPDLQRPVRSSNLGRRAKTEGVYPLVAGGSPVASPTSRLGGGEPGDTIHHQEHVPAKVAKYSAMAVATKAPLRRTIAG